MSRLNELFLDTSIVDDEVLIRSLNTLLGVDEDNEDKNEIILNSNDIIYYGTLNFVELFKELLIKFNRPLIKEFVMEIKKDYTFEEFDNAFIKYNIHTESNYKNLWFICYLRSYFEITLIKYVYFYDPKYAAQQTLGNLNIWNLYVTNRNAIKFLK